MTSSFPRNLSQDLLKLFENNDEYNVIVEVGEGPSKQSFKAHTTILCYRCPYLYNELKGVDYDDKNIKHIKKPNVLIKVFDIIVKYIYGGIVTLENIETSIIFDLLMSADELGLEELSKYIESHLINHHASWLRLNFSRIYQRSHGNDNFVLLREFYNDIIIKHPGIVLDSDEFGKISEKALISILRRDDLQLEESKIWDYVIKWGIAQNPIFPSAIEQWKEKDFLVLKKTLQNCLPHVRFFQISSKEIFLKVRPYQQILETQLWTDIMSKIMAPELQISSEALLARKPLRSNKLSIGDVPSSQPLKIPSEIITAENKIEIKSWIDAENIAWNSYEFRLIWRSDGENVEGVSFYDSCVGKRNLLFLVKVKDADEILGGFNPTAWIHETHHSFIFSLQNGNVKKSIYNILSNVNVNDFCCSFGDSDLTLGFIKGQMEGIRKQKTYGIFPRYNENNFNIDKMEIFQLLTNY